MSIDATELSIGSIVKLEHPEKHPDYRMFETANTFYVNGIFKLQRQKKHNGKTVSYEIDILSYTGKDSIMLYDTCISPYEINEQILRDFGFIDGEAEALYLHSIKLCNPENEPPNGEFYPNPINEASISYANGFFTVVCVEYTKESKVKSSISYPRIKYVHQLQYLYKSLSGKMLDIIPPPF